MILSLTLFLLASLANAIQYTSTFRYSTSIFTRWPHFFGELSKRNKYAQRLGQLIKAPDTWYYRRYKLLYKERFPLSATFLVCLTDGFHFFQFLRTTLIIASVMTFDYQTDSTFNIVCVFMAYRCIYSGIFELCYSKLFIR